MTHHGHNTCKACASQGLPENYCADPCACGTPSKANYHTHVVYDPGPDSDITYVDVYTCAEHTYDGEMQWVMGENHYPLSDLQIAGLRKMLGWAWSDKGLILEVTQTELR